MSVHQVEEYYIHLEFKGSLSPNAHDEIESLLEDEGFSNFEFQDNDSVLIVDDISSEHEGEELEERIKQLL